MAKPQDFFGASPKTVLNKPFFHAQDKSTQNTASQTFSAGLLHRRLNTVISNDIQGASLVSNEVNLPAGTYYVEGFAQSYGTVVNIDQARALITTSNNTVLLQGLNTQIYYGRLISVSGVITLDTPTALRLQQHVPAGGAQLNGTAMNNTYFEIYADLKIWQLDRSLEIAPKAVNSGLQTIPSMNTEGGIMGFDISKTGTNQVTVTKGSCLDSGLVVPLALTTDTTATIPAVANTIYHIFVVKLVAGGVMAVRVYTSEVAVTSDVLVEKWRWIGFCRCGSGTSVQDFILVDGLYHNLDKSNPVIQSVTSAKAAINIGVQAPASRVIAASFGCGTNQVDDVDRAFSIYHGLVTTLQPIGYGIMDGAYGQFNHWNYARMGERGSGTLVPFFNGVTSVAGDTTTVVYLKQVKLRR